MLRLSRRLALLPAVLALLAAGAGRVDAQTVVVTSPAPVVTTCYAPPPATVVVPSSVTVATYRYGVLPRRQVTVSTYTPAPAAVVTTAPAVVFPRPVRAVRYYYAPVYYYP
jgi:hypothetical protein